MTYTRRTLVRLNGLIILVMTTGCAFLLLACEDKPLIEPLIVAISDTTKVFTVPKSDSTSHNYTWKTWIFGDTPTSYWLDVSAIDENNAIVVGHVELRDSARAPHAARWDGIDWRFFEILLQHQIILNAKPDSITTYASATMSCVWGQIPNNWTFTHGVPIYFDNTTFVTDTYFYHRPDTIVAMGIWGDEDDRWYYGFNGKIHHARGRTYKLQPVVTYNDIHGMAANKHEAWAVSRGEPLGTVLHYSNGVWRNWSNHVAIPLYSTYAVWCDEIGMQPGGTVVMVGNNIVQYDTTWENVTRPLVDFMPRQRFFRCVHGSGRNNIWAAGDYGSVAHFNGNTWVRYPEIAGGPGLWYYSVWALEKRVFLVGQIGTQAIIVMGTRVD